MNVGDTVRDKHSVNMRFLIRSEWLEVFTLTKLYGAGNDITLSKYYCEHEFEVEETRNYRVLNPPPPLTVKELLCQPFLDTKVVLVVGARTLWRCMKVVAPTVLAAIGILLVAGTGVLLVSGVRLLIEKTGN